jgi:uncharacterized membrane protein
MGMVKITDPRSDSVLGGWATLATALEVALGAAFFVPRLARLAAWSLLWLSLVYACVVVYLGLSNVPVSKCGCLGASLHLSLGAHLVILGIVGLLACACVACGAGAEGRNSSRPV